MRFNGYKFYERTRTEYPSQTICRGVMDMGDYDEVAIVSIEGSKAVAYVEDELIEVVYY